MSPTSPRCSVWNPTSITTNDLFLFDYGMGIDEDGRYLGRLKATGFRPRFSEHLEQNGIPLSGELFEPEPFQGRPR